MPGKNLLRLGGTSLLGIAIRSARDSRGLSRTIVSTEDDDLRQEALAHDAEVPFRRPVELATDTASTWDVMRHAVKWLEEEESWHTDILVVLQPTTPFRRGHHIDAVLRRMAETEASVCLTVKPVEYPPQWMLRRNRTGQIRPLMEGTWPSRRQDAEPAFQPNGMVYAIASHRLYERNPVLAPDAQSVVVDVNESVNIDDPLQFELARVMWTRTVSDAVN